MTDPLSALARALSGPAEDDLPAGLSALYRALPHGADLGTVRILDPEEILEERPRAALSPALLPIAEEGSLDLFALRVPSEPGLEPSVVCAVSLETGVYAPVATSVKGFAAWLLLLREAQAALPLAPGLDREALAAETREGAAALAGAFGLEALLGQRVEPDSGALAHALLLSDASSPWACSLLARALEEPGGALARLAPALAAAPFAAGLLEQAAGIFLARGDLARAGRSLGAALGRLEPNLQAPPHRIEEVDEERGEPFAPFDPVAAWQWLEGHRAQAPADFRGSAPQAFLRVMERSGLGGRRGLEPSAVIDFARRRGLGGDLPGGRWVLHFAFAAARSDRGARAQLAEELTRAWRLAGNPWYARGFTAIARAGGP